MAKNKLLSWIELCSYVDTSIYENDQEGLYYQGNHRMTSPICRLTIGDYLTELQIRYIKDFNISVPPDYPWDTIIDDGGKCNRGVTTSS